MKKMLAILSTITVLSTNFTTIISCKSTEVIKKRRHSKNNDWDEGRWDHSDWDSGEDQNKDDDNKDDKNDNHEVDNNNQPDKNDEDNKNENEQEENNIPIDPEENEENLVESEKKKEIKNKDFYIVDLEDKQEQILDGNREWAGTLKAERARTIFENQLKRGITNEENAVIDKFTNAMQFKASKNSINKFNFFMQHKTFITFNQLVKQIDNYNEQHPKQYLDVPLELFREFASDKKAFEEAILKVYNTASNFFGKEYGFRMLNALTMFKPGPDNNINGQTSTGLDFKIRVSSSIVARTEAEKEWISGSKSTRHLYKTFVHEFGHVVYNFHNFTNLDRSNTWFFSGLNNEFSKNEFFNQSKTNICKKWEKEQFEKEEPCKYREADLNTPVTDKYYKIVSSKIPKDGSIDQNEELKKFLLQRVKNLHLPGRKISEKKQFIDEILVAMFTNSTYGRSKIGETHAEGFAYWLLTPENERTKAWELWNEFFLEHLPKQRKMVQGFLLLFSFKYFIIIW